MNRTKLLDFYFGLLDERETLETESHLLQEPAWMEEYFQLKRELAQSPSQEIRPSQAIKFSIKNQVFETPVLSSLKRDSGWKWAVAVAASVLLIFGMKSVILDDQETKTPGVKVDMSDNSSISLDIL